MGASSIDIEYQNGGLLYQQREFVVSEMRILEDMDTAEIQWIKREVGILGISFLIINFLSAIESQSSKMRKKC